MESAAEAEGEVAVLGEAAPDYANKLHQFAGNKATSAEEGV